MVKKVRVASVLIQVVALALVVGPWQVMSVSGQQRQTPPSGGIVGRVFQLPPETTAVVFLCDGDTGLPIKRATASAGHSDTEWGKYRTAVTGADGKFEFSELPSGNYRLFAQSWTGLTGLPEKLISRTKAEFYIRGVANNVRIASDRPGSPPVRVDIRPLGKRSIVLDPTPAEANAFLWISQGETLGDPSGSILVCGDDFLSKVCLFVCFHDPHAVVHGLPDDAHLTLVTFYYDNVAGAGGTRFHTRDKKASFFVYAGWSNGYKKPPQQLERLVKALKENDELRQRLPDLLGFSDETASEAFKSVLRLKARPQQVWDKLGGATRLIDIPGVGKYRVADVLMASNFAKRK